LLIHHHKYQGEASKEEVIGLRETY